MNRFIRHIRYWCARHGMAPIELLIVVLVLGVLASLIVPPFTAASNRTRELARKEAALRNALQFIRTQIAVFKVQHRDVPPGYPEGNPSLSADGQLFVRQLTEYSDASCRLSPSPAAQFPLGKYLDAFPSNPLSGCGGVWIDAAAAPAADPTKPLGWIYNPKTLDFRPNSPGADSRGVAYTDY